MKDMELCPFCGGEDIEIVTDMFGDDNYIVICKSCKAQVPGETMGQAIKNWNTRIKPDEERRLGIDVMLALEDCIEHFDDSNWPDDCGYSKADLEKAAGKLDIIWFWKRNRE